MAAAPRKTTTTARPPVADRKPKQAAAAQKAEATNGSIEVNLNGRDWTIAANALNDFEFLEEFGAAMGGNPFALPSALRRLLGEEQYIDLKDLLRDEEGHLDTEVVSDFLVRLFQEANPNS